MNEHGITGRLRVVEVGWGGSLVAQLVLLHGLVEALGVDLLLACLVDTRVLETVYGSREATILRRFQLKVAIQRHVLLHEAELVRVVICLHSPLQCHHFVALLLVLQVNAGATEGHRLRLPRDRILLLEILEVV